MAKSATQSKASFASILDQPVADAVRPPMLPRGYYTTVVQSYRYDTAGTGTEFVEFMLKILEPIEKNGEVQVDEDELEAFGSVHDSVIPVRFFLTERSKYRLREFLEHCGVEFDDVKSFKQTVPEAVNAQIIAHVVHEPWRQGEGMSARVRSTAPVE